MHVEAVRGCARLPDVAEFCGERAFDREVEIRILEDGRFLTVGDVVRAEIEGLGFIENTVVAEP